MRCSWLARRQCEAACSSSRLAPPSRVRQRGFTWVAEVYMCHPPLEVPPSTPRCAIPAISDI